MRQLSYNAFADRVVELFEETVASFQDNSDSAHVASVLPWSSIAAA